MSTQSRRGGGNERSRLSLFLVGKLHVGGPCLFHGNQGPQDVLVGQRLIGTEDDLGLVGFLEQRRQTRRQFVGMHLVVIEVHLVVRVQRNDHGLGRLLGLGAGSRQSQPHARRQERHA